MKKLMMTTAIAALAGTAAMAQDIFRGEADPTEIYASDFIGMRVYSSEAPVEGDAFEGVQGDWEDIGEINDVILSREGNVEAVLVDIGGFLGMGERQIAVDMEAIRFVSDSATADDENDYFLVMSAARGNFEEAPEYTPLRSDMGATGDEAGTGTAVMPAQDGQAAPAEGETAADGSATTPPADGTTPPADGTAADGTTPPAEGETAADGTATMTPPADGTAVDGTATTRDPFMREGYETYTELTSETVTGAPVYDTSDEWIGDVSELVLTEDGQITDIVMDIGGFLGIGAKTVRLALDDIDILRETGGDEVRIYVPMTREELEALPTYEN